MWFLIVLFLPIGILLAIIDDSSKKRKKNKSYEELNQTIQKMENECNELKNIVRTLEDSQIEIKDETSNKETNKNLYYDDYISEEEIQKELKNIKEDDLSENEVIFLKFMNNKSVDITFSPRWEFEYSLKPRIELAKLLKLEYLTYSSWYNNVKNATTKELKEVLKLESLKVSGNKQELVERVLGNVDADLLEKTFNKGRYVLTDKGTKAIEENKELFMSDKEKAGEEFAELTDYEYGFLKELGQTEEYIKLKNNELSFKKGYRKNDILWAIYNIQKDKLIRNKQYGKASIIYDQMFRICFNEKRYLDSLMFLLCSSYLEGYNAIKEYEEEDPYEMQEWFCINLSDIERRVKIIEENTSVIKNNSIDWLISNSIDKYLITINKEPIRSAFKDKLSKIFSTI